MVRWPGIDHNLCLANAISNLQQQIIDFSSESYDQQWKFYLQDFRGFDCYLWLEVLEKSHIIP
jgi:hypothetical protein